MLEFLVGTCFGLWASSMDEEKRKEEDFRRRHSQEFDEFRMQGLSTPKILKGPLFESQSSIFHHRKF